MEPPAPEVYPHPIAFNVLGGAGNFADGDDHTDEERKMMFETRKILGDESIAHHVTCARVPVRYSHSESVNVQTRDAARQLEEARELLRARARARGRRRPGAPRLPDGAAPPPGATRCSSAASAATRRTSAALNLWVVSDNLLKGAATNAVQIAEVLHERGLVRPRVTV